MAKYEVLVDLYNQRVDDPRDSNTPPEYLRHRKGDVVEVSAVDAKRLLAAGALRKPGKKTEAADTEAAGDADTGVEGAPAKNASKDTWVEYAVSQGADRDAADAATKDELIAEFGSNA